MKAYLHLIFIIITCCIYRYTSIEIKPELKKNNLKFGYAINYKYEGMLAHSFDRFYVVTKFILPSIKDLKFSTLNYDDRCIYLQESDRCSAKVKEYILDLILYCKRLDHVYIIINNRLSLLMTQHITF